MEYIDVNRLYLDVLNELLYIVRLAEGYNNLTVLNGVEKVNRINF